MLLAGWARSQIVVEARGHAMFGYGMWHHRARGQETPLFARAFFLRDRARCLIFCCADLGYISHAVRAAVCAQLAERLGADFDEASLVLTCTHTHSGPGGCSHEALYNIVTPGFVTEHVRAIVAAITQAILDARERAAPTLLRLYEGTFEDEAPVAWNRSLRAYNRNPDVVQRRDEERHLAIDRTMHVLGFHRDGKLEAMISLFGVHATCLGNALERYDADNKGYAAVHTEETLREAGASDAVAIFAQATAGDVSPYFHGAGDWERRKQIRGEAEYEYARRNGRLQSSLALEMVNRPDGIPLDGSLDAILTYADFTGIKANPSFASGKHDAFTSEPCYGVTFFTGTPVDGRGMPGFLGAFARVAARVLRRWRLARLRRYPAEVADYYRRLYAAQDPKAVLLEAGPKTILGRSLAKLAMPGFVDPTIQEMKRQARIGAIEKSPLVPTVLPLQIVRIGALAIVCCPGEFTTMAGARLLAAVGAHSPGGTDQMLLCTYCNDYMGYVTTPEEYEEDAFEGSATIFGKWTLAAFQTRLTELAREMGKPEALRQHDRTTRPPPVPAEELALRTDLPVPA